MNSAAIQDVKYDRQTSELYVTFCSGSKYRYYGVPGHVAADLSFGDAICKTAGTSPCGSWFPGKSPSVGAAFNQMIKDKYPYERM